MAKSNGTKKAGGSASRNGSNGSDVNYGVDAIVKVALETIKASPNFAVFVLIIVIFAIGPLIFTAILFAKSQYELGVWLIAGSYVAILVVGCIMYLVIRLQNQSTSSSPNNVLEVHWSRPMLKMPWDNNRFGDLAGSVEAIRNKAYAFLSGEAHITGMIVDDIRVNVFLPDYTGTSDGEVCLLVMAPTLCVGMEGCSDANLSLRIDQGMTGKVYKNQRGQLVGSVFDALERKKDFHDTYALTADQKKLIHPDLKWIVSSPLNVNYKGENRAIGVFNIDGLKHDVPMGTLEILAARILYDVMMLAKELSRQPIVEGVVGVRVGG